MSNFKLQHKGQVIDLLPDGDLNIKGPVQLSDVLNDDIDKAVVPKVVNDVQHFAESVSVIANQALQEANTANNNAASIPVAVFEDGGAWTPSAQKEYPDKPANSTIWFIKLAHGGDTYTFKTGDLFNEGRATVNDSSILYYDKITNKFYNNENGNGKIGEIVTQYGGTKRGNSVSLSLSDIANALHNWLPTNSVTKGSKTEYATGYAVKLAYDRASAAYTKAVNAAKPPVIPDATIKHKGVVQLSNSTTSSSQVLAATPLAVKNAMATAKSALSKINAAANPKIPDASTTTKGVVKLSHTITSKDHTLAASIYALSLVNAKVNQVNVKATTSIYGLVKLATSINDADQDDYVITSLLLRTELAKGVASYGGRHVRIGYEAGAINQSSYAIAVGESAGKENQNIDAIAIGQSAGKENQNIDAIAIGAAAGEKTQGENSVAIGHFAGRNGQGTDAIAIGRSAGDGQGFHSIAIGLESGIFQQHYDAISIGTYSGHFSQGAQSIAIGSSAGYSDLGVKSIAIGFNAGKNNMPDNSIAIGESAAPTAQHQIVIGKSRDTVRIGNGHVTAISDRRDKKDIDYDGVPGLDFVMKLKTCAYRYDHRERYWETQDDGTVIQHEPDGSKADDILQIGLISQDVKKVMDELGIEFFGYHDELDHATDEQKAFADRKNLIYTAFIAPLIKGMQEQQRTIQSMKSEIEILKSRLL